MLLPVGRVRRDRKLMKLSLHIKGNCFVGISEMPM